MFGGRAGSAHPPDYLKRIDSQVEKIMDMDELVSSLRTQRDELRVRLHLMKAEVRDEFEDLETQWNHLESRLSRAADASKDSAGEVGAAAKQLAEEIGAAYARIKKALQ